MKKQGSVLIIDDNKDFLEAIRLLLIVCFEKVVVSKNPNLIPRLLEERDYEVVLLDMNFARDQTSGNEGFFWMRKILDSAPNTSVVLITAFGEVELAVRAIKDGATDFIEKSWDEKKILSTIISASKISLAKLEISRIKNKKDHLTEQLFESNKIYRCNSPAMVTIYDMVSKVAKTDANTLILGENGTGKEVIAHEIHYQSDRNQEVFVSVNVSAIPETLFESELFGYAKGAFTDAKKDKAGKFEIAHGGTLFLDEIGDLDLNLQSKLLSAIQNKEVCRLGSHKTISLDVRIICATNRPLYQLADEGLFREDLLYRINSFVIEIPPLRERQKDILPLAKFFLDKFASKYRKPELRLKEDAAEKILKHPWKGNIRELSSVIEKAVILADQPTIGVNDLFLGSTMRTHQQRFDTFDLAENEKRIIIKALERFNGNISETAKNLGVNRATLYNKMKKYEI